MKMEVLVKKTEIVKIARIGGNPWRDPSVYVSYPNGLVVNVPVARVYRTDMKIGRLDPPANIDKNGGAYLNVGLEKDGFDPSLKNWIFTLVTSSVNVLDYGSSVPLYAVTDIVDAFKETYGYEEPLAVYIRFSLCVTESHDVAVRKANEYYKSLDFKEEINLNDPSPKVSAGISCDSAAKRMAEYAHTMNEYYKSLGFKGE